MKAGRKRHVLAKRQPDGRVRRARREETEAGYSPVLVRRMAEMAARKLADAFYGSALGIAFLSGKITREQAAAGRRWAQVRQDWIRAIDASRLDIKSLTLSYGSARADPDSESFEGHRMSQRDISACSRYHRLEAVLGGCGHYVEKNTRELAEAPSLRSLTYEEMGAAVVGLEALHRYLQGLVTHPS